MNLFRFHLQTAANRVLLFFECLKDGTRIIYKNIQSISMHALLDCLYLDVVH